MKHLLNKVSLLAIAAALIFTACKSKNNDSLPEKRSSVIYLDLKELMAWQVEQVNTVEAGPKNKDDQTTKSKRRKGEKVCFTGAIVQKMQKLRDPETNESFFDRAGKAFDVLTGNDKSAEPPSFSGEVTFQVTHYRGIATDATLISVKEQ